MDEKKRDPKTSNTQSNRHLRLVVSRSREPEAKKPIWPLWVTIGVAVILLGTITIMNRAPFPGGDMAQPIGFHPQVSVNVADMEDGIRSVSAALIQPDWSLAARRNRTLRDMWILLLPMQTERLEETSWANADVAEFEAALTRLDEAIEERDLNRARDEVTTLERVILPYRLP